MTLVARSSRAGPSDLFGRPRRSITVFFIPLNIGNYNI